jgi:hypothetical protein
VPWPAPAAFKAESCLVIDKTGDGWFMDYSTVRDMCTPLSYSKSCRTAEMQSKAEGAGRWVRPTLADGMAAD